MRAIWKGSLSFGLVNVPVKLFSATEDHDVPLHQVHDDDGGRIRYQRKCEICGEVVPFEHIDKAYDDGDQTVVLTKADLASLPAERSRDIDVVEFVPSEQVDAIRLDRSYYLAPDSSSMKAYALLRRTLEETERTAIVRISLRQRTRLAALRVHDEVLLLQTLLWDDEVRDAEFPGLDEHPRVSENELKMAQQLVESFSKDFEPEKFDDEYQVQLRQLVEAKLEQGDTLDTDETFGRESDSGGGEVLDLMEALRQSVERRRAGGAKKAPARKAPAKKKTPTTKSTDAASAPKKRASAASRSSSSEERAPAASTPKKRSSGGSGSRKAAS
ncbi:Ku protein [Schumannella luteola]|uniref:Non-homologous end joining protein Ku n=1 Tax=Schumannella luteola TaxID=472059 RepID=A0A852YF27_9MICO|nr:Ku protein [Schumannella luteola]NYG99761.1 DNA end-binding protein Ku [Schumannella luteola]TPX06538.1 Ku protein [Schumannella luteola]